MTEAIMLHTAATPKVSINDGKGVSKSPELTTFKDSLKKVAEKSLTENGTQTIADILKDIDQAISALSSVGKDTKLPPQLKKMLDSLSQHFETLKPSVKEGKVPKNIGDLLKSIDVLKTVIQDNHSLINDDPFNQLLNHLKKRLGTDAIPFFTAIAQSIITTFGVQKQSDKQPMEIPIHQAPTHGIRNITFDRQEEVSKTNVKSNIRVDVKTDNNVQLKTVAKSNPITDVKPAHKSDVPAKVEPNGKTNTAIQAGSPKNNVINLKQMMFTKGNKEANNPAPQNASQPRSVDGKNISMGQWVAGKPVHRLQQLVFHRESKTPSPGVQILDQVKAVLAKGNIKSLPNGGLELTIKLHPANLGTVQVTISQTDAGLQAVLTSTSQATKDLLQSQLANLKQSFTAIGITVHKLDVGQFNQAQQNPQQFNGQAYQQSSGGGQQDGQRQSNQNQQNTDYNNYGQESEVTFEEWLLEGGGI